MAIKETKKTAKPVKAENLKLKVALRKQTTIEPAPKRQARRLSGKEVCEMREKIAIASQALRALSSFLMS